MDQNNEWENFENEIIIEDDIFENEPKKEEIKNNETFDLFEQLAGNPKTEIQNIYENDLNFLDNLAATPTIQDEIKEEKNVPKPINLMNSIFSYLTSGETPQSNPQVKQEATLKEQKNESKIQFVQDSISNLGASYFAAAKGTLLGGESTESKSKVLEPKEFKNKELKKEDIQKDFINNEFSEQVNKFEKQDNSKIDQFVLQNLIEQNKNLKSLLIKQRIEIKKSENNENTITQFEQNLADSKKEQNLEDFDAYKEFQEIQKLYNINKLQPNQQDISYLYSSCFYSKDLLLIQNLKVKIFQCIAERALRNQEILFKSTQRRGMSQNQINPIHIFIENNQLRQNNQSLRGQLEQLQQTLENKIQQSSAKEQIYKNKISKLNSLIQNQKQQIKNVKQDWISLKDEAKEFQKQIQNNKIFQDIKQVTQNQTAKLNNENETFRKSLLTKNKEIGDLFMKTKNQEQDFEQKLKDLEKQIRGEQEKELGSIVFQKNQEIAKQYNDNLSLKQKLENIQQDHEEQLEILETFKQESQMLKESIRNYQIENNQLNDQIQDLQNQNDQNDQIKNQHIEEIKFLQIQIQEKDGEIQDKDGEIQEIQEYIQMKNDELRQTEEEIDQYQADIEKKQLMIDKLENQKQDLISQNQQIQLLYEKQINELQFKLEEQSKIKNQIKMPILNLQNINQNSVLFQITQNENKEQSKIDDILQELEPKIEQKQEESIELNNEGWGGSSSFDMDLQQSVNLQQNQINENHDQSDLQRMKSALNSTNLDKIISQINAPVEESQKLEDFFQDLKQKKLIQKIEVNNELDREIFDNNILEKDANNQDNLQEWGELDIQLESDRIEITNEEPVQNIEPQNSNQQVLEKEEFQQTYFENQTPHHDSSQKETPESFQVNIEDEEPIQNEDILKIAEENIQVPHEFLTNQNDQNKLEIPKKRKQKHKKQKSVHLNKSNQFTNFNNQPEIQSNQENQSVQKEDQVQFFLDLQNNQPDQKNLNAISEEDANAQGESSRKKENSEDKKKNPQIIIESSDKKIKNLENMKDKDNDFNSSVFPESIEDEKIDEQMIMTMDVNLQLLDSVQSQKLSFIQEFQGKSPQKEIQDFIVEYQENRNDILIEVQEETDSPSKFHKKASQSFHQRNAEMIDKIDQIQNLQDQEFLESSLKEQLDEYDKQNERFQELSDDNIKPPAQPDEQMQNGEIPEQMLSDLEDDMEIQQIENVENVYNFEDQKNNIEIIPEMEEEDDEIIQQDQQIEEIEIIEEKPETKSENNSEKKSDQKQEEQIQIENNFDIELQDDLWGGDPDQNLFQKNEIHQIQLITNENYVDQMFEDQKNHEQKSKQYQNIRKSNKQKDKLNLKDKFLLLQNQTNEMELNRMIQIEINKEELGNIDNPFNTLQNRVLESARVQASNPLQQVKSDVNQAQKQVHGHSNSQQFGKHGQNKPLKTIRQKIPNPNLKSMENQLSESLEEIEDSYKESEYYSPIKKRFEDQSQITSSEFNGLSSQKKMRRIQLQSEEESLQDLEDQNEIKQVVEDVKGEEMDDLDDKIAESQNNEIVFSELDGDNEFGLGISEKQVSQNVEVFDQILKGSQDFNYLNNFNDFENEIQSIQSITTESKILSVQKEEENVNQLTDFVNFEEEKIKQVQIQMGSVQQNIREQRKNLTDQNNQ